MEKGRKHGINETQEEGMEEKGREDRREKRGDKLYVSKGKRTGKNKEEEGRKELRDKMEVIIKPLLGINE